MLDLSAHRQLVAQASGLRFQGKVVQVVGLSIEVEGLRLPLGEICHLYPERATAGASRITAEGMAKCTGYSTSMSSTGGTFSDACGAE